MRTGAGHKGAGADRKVGDEAVRRVFGLRHAEPGRDGELVGLAGHRHGLSSSTEQTREHSTQQAAHDKGAGANQLHHVFQRDAGQPGLREAGGRGAGRPQVGLVVGVVKVGVVALPVAKAQHLP